ncbi:membrane protein (plasmid) [Persicobacter psychrovividus]|uniref:Membrane protein n=2 Tax=Persicobacter psychrovividus TaxID=387638 RepID=A0ABN6LDF8_9BACT|nr:membrane protein [Persicobacter psychrovividus]
MIFAGTLISSCDDFLDVKNTTLIDKDTYFQTDLDLMRMLSASYSNMADVRLYANNYWRQRELLTNDVFTIETEDDLAGNYNFNFREDSKEFRGIWSSLYKGIRRANTVIKEVPTTITNQALVDRAKAEAKLLRANYYFTLIMQWDYVPFRDENNMDLFAVPQLERQEILAYLQAELEEIIAENALPKSYNGKENEEQGRVTIWFAKGLLAKSHLFFGEPQKAQPLFKDIIDNGGFQLMQNTEDIMNVNNRFSPENLFEVLYDHKVGGALFWFDDGLHSSEGTQRNVYLESMVQDGNDPDKIGGYQNLRPTEDLIETFEPNDFRLKAFIRQKGDTLYYRNPRIIGGEAGDYVVSTSEDPVIAKGLTSKANNPNGNDESFPIMRLADIYLMYAESLIGSNDAEAMQYIDMVRGRAFYSPIDQEVKPHQSTQQLVDGGKSLMQVLKDERRKELCFEGHRYNDLRRWGDLNTIVSKIDGEPRFIEGRAFYPVPQQEIDKSGGVLVQSPNYK